MTHWKDLMVGKYGNMELIDRKALLEQLIAQVDDIPVVIDCIKAQEEIKPHKIIEEYEKTDEGISLYRAIGDHNEIKTLAKALNEMAESIVGCGPADLNGMITTYASFADIRNLIHAAAIFNVLANCARDEHLEKDEIPEKGA